ncbi:MAG: lysine--tRNA ligase [Candidatus Pacebacteria bacterium]|nr:lysine--tRNA ligase [Candidatus Paceibacterota bacterium]
MSLEEFRNDRIKKLSLLRDAGINPYPSSSSRTHRITQIIESFDSFVESQQEIVLAGRIIAQRGHGGLLFLDIDDGSGTIQFLLKRDAMDASAYDFFGSVIDVGDIIEARGVAFLTKRNERSLQVVSASMLSKSVRPLPEKWHGIEDAEERLRNRAADFISRQEERTVFIKKALFWKATREFLTSEGGMEVETPILELIPGGADAEPFETHMNALDIDLFLRIAPELNLKRLITGGFEKLFEIGRVFRNEGIDREHLQDYTTMEMYWSYTDYEQLMEFVERLVKNVIQSTLGTLTHAYRGQTIDWGSPWKRIDYFEVFHKYTGLDLATATEKDLITYAQAQGIDTSRHAGRGRLIDIIFKKSVRPELVEPGFLVLPPVDIEPLAKRYPNDPTRVERFQIVACGSELGKGFSELNDPLDQRERFVEQARLGEAGDKEAQRMDEDYVATLELAMPPTAGFSFSERLFAFLLDRPIRETTFFPIIRPKE